jgi:uncharacterized protein YdhG (YjbR/CyaY superfamily)
MQNKPPPKSIDEYIAGFPPKVQKVLKELRALIKKTAPGVTERISYAIPTFDLNGRYLVYFAGWKDHLSLYPVTAALEKEFEEELRLHRTGKGTVQFALEAPLPKDLIRRMVEVRLREIQDSPDRGGYARTASKGSTAESKSKTATGTTPKSPGKSKTAAGTTSKSATKGKTATGKTRLPVPAGRGKVASAKPKSATGRGKAGNKSRAGSKRSVSQKGRER